MKHRGKLITAIYEVNEKCLAYQDGERPRLSLNDDGNITWVELGGICVWSTESSSDPNGSMEDLLNELTDRISELTHNMNRVNAALIAYKRTPAT